MLTQVTEADEMLIVLEALQAVRCRAWVAGGWGVDLLVGRQTRPHRDLDLAVDAAGLDRGLDALAALGYAADADWLPVRIELHRPGRGWVDLHPVSFDEHDDGVQAGPEGTVFGYPRDSFVQGSLDGVGIACLSRVLQLTFHQGYELRDVDRHDLALLLALPSPPEPRT